MLGKFRISEQAFMILAGAATLTAILMNLEFNLLEANLYDFRMSHSGNSGPNDDIVMVTLDNATTKALNDFSPLPLDTHVGFIEALEKLEPKAVGYLIDMNHVNELNPELIRAEWGSRFVSAARRMEIKGIPVVMGTAFDVTGEVIPPFPLSSLNHAIAMIHQDGNVFAEDKITRRALTYIYDKPVFHLDLAQRLGAIPPGTKPRGSYDAREINGQYFFFKYHGNPALDLSSREAGEAPAENPKSYRRISFIDVLRGSVPRDAIQGKIILVGTLSKEDSTDFTFTPYSKSLFVNPAIAVHANILDSLIRNDGIVRAPAWINFVFTFSLIALVLSWVVASKPLHGVFATLALALGYMAVAQLLFGFKGIWIRMSQPLVGIFLAYYLVVPYRLIREYKQRWDYQRKNELLVQVEELKTNFLNLVTHDLKTPVARIQGLAEVLLRNGTDRLISSDRETLRHVIDSTDELNRFISSILELSKVEGGKLKLNLESKDINQIIERCVEGFRAQARARNIQVVSDLEPIFPIKVDPHLISRVINNLVDNAIKYSPADSTVEIVSREVDSRVEISVSDQGIGMNEAERENLFTRFYRAKNDATQSIGGTGLGLYLTKYFIEAHQGTVAVESQPGQGSVFKISLPVEPAGSAGLARSASDASGSLTGRTIARIQNSQIFTRFTRKKENAHV